MRWTPARAPALAEGPRNSQWELYIFVIPLYVVVGKVLFGGGPIRNTYAVPARPRVRAALVASPPTCFELAAPAAPVFGQLI